MKYHYESAVRWYRYRDDADIRVGAQPPKGWEATCHLLDNHPITGKAFKEAQWWVCERHMKTYTNYEFAKAAAKPGDEIWACDSRRHPDRHGWTVMTKQEVDEYIRTTPEWLRVWSHWETIKT